jgi:hypothetical protein
VDQISPPFRIALVALLAVCAVWFTVLRPKAPSAETPPAAPGTTGLANDVDAAKGAVAKGNAASAATDAATGGSTATSEPKTATSKPATSTAKPTARGAHAAVAGKNAHVVSAGTTPSAPLLRAIDRKRAVVLLFWNRKGSEDRAVRRAVAATNRRKGDVVVKVAPVKDVARYGAITRGAQVLQSPTVLVLAPGRKARAIVGFTTKGEIDQAAGDALAAAKKKK